MGDRNEAIMQGKCWPGIGQEEMRSRFGGPRCVPCWANRDHNTPELIKRLKRVEPRIRALLKMNKGKQNCESSGLKKDQDPCRIGNVAEIQLPSTFGNAGEKTKSKGKKELGSSDSAHMTVSAGKKR